MHLSKRGEYGLRAMIEIATALRPQDGQGKECMVQIKDVAASQHIPAKFLEQILLTLKNAGMLHSRMGVGGGYYLSRPAAEISLGQIVRVLDGPLAPIRCVSQTAYETCGCPDEQTCGLRLVMLDVRNAIADILDRTTLAEVTERVDLARTFLESSALSGSDRHNV
jgi:Rrf2 family protein